jgi:protein-L-isoaspartate O-methyltransferase
MAAILAHLARKVCTIEVIPPLAEAAAKALRDLAYVPPIGTTKSEPIGCFG